VTFPIRIPVYRCPPALSKNRNIFPTLSPIVAPPKPDFRPLALEDLVAVLRRCSSETRRLKNKMAGLH
jgi:hypothetical protein